MKAVLRALSGKGNYIIAVYPELNDVDQLLDILILCREYSLLLLL